MTIHKQISVLGVRISSVSLDQASDQVCQWLKGNQKHYITTPNIEFIILAQRDDAFRSILNESDLAIPDSARLGWAYNELEEKNKLLKILKWPLFIFPNFFRDLPVTPGVDLMEKLCQVSEEKGFRVGLLGGGEGVAEKAKECLIKRYPKLKVGYAESGGVVMENGEWRMEEGIKCDILFVAFGQIKQEKWIKRYMNKIPAKVYMGVGGAFDYISGGVERAPSWIRSLGLEWFYRLVKQPWRIKRFGALFKFVFLVLIK